MTVTVLLLRTQTGMAMAMLVHRPGNERGTVTVNLPGGRAGVVLLLLEVAKNVGIVATGETTPETTFTSLV